MAWLPSVRIRGRSCATLTCRATSQIAYDVMLPANASVTAWCAVRDVSTNGRVAVDFEIRVRAGGLESSERRVIEPSRGRRLRRWQRLEVAAPRAGPANVVLATHSPTPGADDSVEALWGEPGVQVARSLDNLVSAARHAVSAWGARGLWYKAWPSNEERLYRLWVREHRPSREALRAQREWSRTRPRTFTLLTLLAGSVAPRLDRTADTVFGQTYPGWEWIIVGNQERLKDVAKSTRRLKTDTRVHLLRMSVEGSRADAWNAALMHAGGEYAALLGEQDLLEPAALYEMARALERLPDCDLLYSDEDRISDDSRRSEPHFKPDWSPDLLLSHNYIGRLALLKRETAIAVGGFRTGYDGAEEWDLLLRLSRSTSRVHRVPCCLYHRGDAQPEASESERAALQDHCTALGLNGEATPSAAGYRLTWPVSGRPLVSIVIPNRDAAGVLKPCLTGLIHATTYPHRELVIVDNGSTDPEVLDLYGRLEREGLGVVVPFDRPFNFSSACNAGAAAARGDLLLFLNNDIEVIRPDWLEELVRWTQRSEVGIVGTKLLYPDRTVQHAGVVFGLGLVGHIFSGADENATGVFGSCDSYRNYLAVTGACQMMRRDVFDRLRGYDERFRLSFSDVVLCLEAWKAGYRVVYVPHACLIHHESHTRKREDWPEDLELLVRYLDASGFAEDPYFHPELNPRSSLPSLRPPFDPTPRQVVREYMDRVLSTTQVPT